MKLGPDTARSVNGFTVVFHPAGGADYTDATHKKIRVDAELYVKPTLRHILYPQSKDLRDMPNSRAEEILANVKRAMEFLGRPVEICTR